MERIFGKDRVETSIEISRRAYKNSKTVILAGYHGQVDSLSGTILAHNKKAPMIYAGRDSLDSRVLKEIHRLGAKKIYILGGETVVSKEIEDSLSAYEVIRLKGNRREETAIKIAGEVKEKSIEEVFLTRGDDGNYSDALAIGPVSGKKSIPIFLTKPNALSKDTKDALEKFGVKKVNIIGGEKAIGKAIEKELKDMNIFFERVYGHDRVETAIKIGEKYSSDSSGFVIANGWEFPDAVVGGYFAAKENASILLSKNKIIDIKNLDYIAKDKKKIYMLGGEKALNKAVYEDLDFIVNKNLVIKEIESNGIEGRIDRVYFKDGKQVRRQNIIGGISTEDKNDKREFKRLFLDGNSVSGTEHIIKAEVDGFESPLYGFYEKNLSTDKWILIQDYSEKDSAIWIPKKEGNYLYRVDIKEKENSEKHISKYIPIGIEASMVVPPAPPAELHSLDITGKNQVKTAHTITAKASGVNGVLYKFYIKDENTGKWTIVQDYSEKNTLVWIPEKAGDYRYAVHIKDKNSAEDKEAQDSKSITIESLKPALAESLEIEGNKIEKTDHLLTAKGTSTNGVLYKFYIKDWTSGKWTVIQDYSEKNTVNWKPDKIGKYSYAVHIKDKNSDEALDASISKEITINPPVYYNVSEYNDSLESALNKQMNIRGTKPQTTSNGRWVNATKDQVKQYIDPDRFLQFKPDEKTDKVGRVTSDTLNLRTGPGVSYEKIGQTTKGKVHQILSEKNGWYMIELDGCEGWVSGAYLSFKEDRYLRSIQVVVNSLNLRKAADVKSDIVSKVLKGQVYIVLEEENGWYKINHGGKIGWVSGDCTKHVNDVPREMYQFMVLSGQCGVTINQMNKELKGKGILEDRGASFIEGARKYNVNELYLMAHSLLETGNGKSALSTGVIVTSVKGKPVTPRKVYNMYGIGAIDSDPFKYGSERAYELGWFTPEIAITEGAHWISESYINNPTYKQDTLYKMRYNPSNPGIHQYATDIAWSYKQIRQIDNIMDYCREMEGVVLRFDIPKYR